MAKTLLEILKDNPNAHIYYDDSGSWSIYKQGEFEKFDKAYQEWDGNGDEPEIEPLYQGADFDGEGYASPLVTALATMLGMTVDSI